MSNVCVKVVRSARDRRVFLRLARQINADQPLWVPPLARDQRREMDPRCNPFYEDGDAQLFLALREGHAVGRIAAIENRRHNVYWNDRIGFFGYYESVDDDEVSSALFHAAEGWLAKRGCDRMRGPTNPSMNQNAGFLIDGFEFPPAIPMPYTRQYYAEQAESAGLHKAMDVIVYGWNYAEYSDEYTQTVLSRIARLSRQVQRRCCVQIRGPDRTRVGEELRLIKTVCNESLKDNWGYVPISDGDMRAARHELERIIDPELFFIAEVDGRAEAVFLACPDYNEVLARMNGRILPWGWITYLCSRRRVNKYVVFVYAATPRADALGVGVVLYEKFFAQCFRKGIKNCETGYVLETNMRMRNTIENFGALPRKRYRVYEKRIG